MLIVKRYKRPLSSILLEGKKVRVTPGVLFRFSKPLAEKRINIYAVSTGECSVSFFIDEGDAEKAVLCLSDIVSKSSFEDISVRKNIGMISVSGKELLNSPGLLYKILKPIAKEKINILAITTSFDSDLIFFDYNDSEKVFKLLNRYIPQKIDIFKNAKEKLKKAKEFVKEKAKEVVEELIGEKRNERVKEKIRKIKK